MSDADVTMPDVIEFALRSDAITTQGTAIAEKLAGYTVGTLPNNRFALAKLLETEPNPVPDAFERAGELLKFMRDAELIGLPTAAPAAAAPTAPTTVNVVTPPKRNEMTLAQLLQELLDHPEDAADIVGYIRNLSVVQDAERKLGSNEWVIVDADNRIIVDETVAHVRSLADPRTHVSPQWKTYWPVTLDRALGNDGRFLIYPFTDNPREMLFRGVDKLRKDWSTLSDDLHEMVIWAIAEGKIVVSNESDVRRVTYEIFSTPLPGWLEDLLAEYRAVKARGDLPVSRYATVAQFRAAGIDVDGTGSRAPFASAGRSAGAGRAFQPERDEAWYRAQLEAVATRPIDSINNAVTRGAAVIRSIKTVNGSITLNNTIVLGHIKTVSGSIAGVAYVPRNAKVSTVNGYVSDDIRELSYKQLYEKAVELGIIQP